MGDNFEKAWPTFFNKSSVVISWKSLKTNDGLVSFGEFRK